MIQRLFSSSVLSVALLLSCSNTGFAQSALDRIRLHLASPGRAVSAARGEVGQTNNSGSWPQFLGPDRNGSHQASEFAVDWPKEGPRKVWERTIGQGFSGPVVADDKLILFHRVGDNETVECLNTKEGKALWSFDYPTSYRDDFGFDEGPRATPAIADGRVYTLGAEGALHCLDLDTGAKRWSVDTKSEYKADKGFFGMVCSPLIEGDAVLLSLGGANGSGIVAFNKATGKLLWKATDDEAGYSSPAAASIHGQRYAFFFTRSGLAALDPKSGEVSFQFPWRSRMHASVNAATPLVIGDLIFISASYQTGAALLRLRHNKPEKVWSADDVLSNHYSTSVHRDGFLYGFDGRVDLRPGPSLRCVELETGKIRWSARLKAGTVTLAGRHLLILLETGELLLALASPEGFKAVARAQVSPSDVRAYPALAQGFLYARSKNKLACFDLTAKGQ